MEDAYEKWAVALAAKQQKSGEHLRDLCPQKSF